MKMISKTSTNLISCFLLSVMVLNGQNEQRSSAAPEIKTFALDPDLKGAVGKSVNLFSGDVNLPVNLVSLPGPNGLGVNVTAVYNSNIQNHVDTWNVEAPTGILGLGWSLDYPKIVRDHKNTGTRHDDDFYLLAGGSSTPLLRTGTSTNGQIYYYQVKNDPNLEIRYYQEDANGDMGYWEVFTGNGITQVFGNTNDSKQVGVRWGNWMGSSVKAAEQKITQSSGPGEGEILRVVTLTYTITYFQQNMTNVWNLSSIVDQWNNRLFYRYKNIKERVGMDELQVGTVTENYYQNIGPPVVIEDLTTVFVSASHTKACYLKKIEDVYGRTIEFNYAQKVYNDSIREYQDPRKICPPAPQKR